MSGAITRYDKACMAISAAKDIDEVKDIADKATALKEYARQAKNRNLEVDAAEIRIRAERRLGEMLGGMEKNKGMATGAKRTASGAFKEPLDKTPTLSSMGISKKLSSRAQKMAAVPEAKFEGMLGEWRGRVEQENERVTTKILAEGNKHFRTNFTGENEWYTPQKYIKLVREVLGEIDLDPASSILAQEKIEAKEFYTIDNDALKKEWHGKIWLNPPYVQPDIALFVDKIVEEFSNGHIEEAIMLTHNYTDTNWFHSAARIASCLCFTRGRIKFYNQDGDIAAPTQGQAFFYFGNNEHNFINVFKEIGFIARIPT